MKSEESKDKIAFKKILGKIGKIISIAITIFIIIMLFRIFVQKKYDVLGYRCFVIGSGSMEPTIYTGDAVIIKEPKSPNDLKEGDIIAFSENNMVIVHRIIKVQPKNDVNLYQTKGDNNNIPDGGFRNFSEIKGKMVLKISNVGIVINFIKKYVFVIVAIIAILILGIFINGFFVHNKKTKDD